MKYPVRSDMGGDGKFSSGNRAAGIPPSFDKPEDMNAVYDEIINAIVQAGYPSDDTLRLWDAISGGMKWYHAGALCDDAGEGSSPAQTNNVGVQAVKTFENGNSVWINHAELKASASKSMKIRGLMDSDGSGHVKFKIESFIFTDGSNGSVETATKTKEFGALVVPSTENTLFTLDLDNFIEAVNVPSNNSYANIKITRLAAASDHSGKISVLAVGVK